MIERAACTIVVVSLAIWASTQAQEPNGKSKKPPAKPEQPAADAVEGTVGIHGTRELFCRRLDQSK